jgi:hypothetical protein
VKVPVKPKPVRVGRTSEDGIAPAMLGSIERGISRRPEVADAMEGRIVFRFSEPIAPLRMTFKARSVLVEDGDLRTPDLVIAGRLPDIVHLATAPHWRGLPSPRHKRGRAALGQVARRRVTVQGDRRLARGLMQLLSVDV